MDKRAAVGVGFGINSFLSEPRGASYLHYIFIKNLTL